MPFPDLSASPDLLAALKAATWGAFDPARDAVRLRDVLLDASPEARRLAIASLGPRLGVPHLQHHGITGLGVSRDGRLLAVGGANDPDDAYAHATASIWDLKTLRVLHSLVDIAGPVGWADQSGCVQWLADGTLVMSHSTNAVGTFDPLGTGDALRGWYVTHDQDTPPEFACSDDQVLISAWGPNGDAAACICEPGSEPRWIGAGVGPLSVPTWSGGEIFGHNAHERAFIDPVSGRVTSRVEAETWVWSADGRRVIVGDAVRDARTDEVLFRFPAGPPRGSRGHYECGFLDPDHAFAVHGDHVAVVSHADQWRIDVEVARPRIGRAGDVRTVVPSPDGQRLAILAADGHVVVAERTGKVLRGSPSGPISGLLWASAARIVGASSHHLAFFDGDGGRLAEHSFLLGPGNTPPPRERVPGDHPTTVLRATPPGCTFYGIEARKVNARPAAMAALMPTLAWQVGRTAWPAEWAPPELGAELLPDPNLPTGTPFTKYLPPPSDTDLTSERIRRALPSARPAGCSGWLLGRSSPRPNTPVRGIPTPSWEIGWYRAPRVLAGSGLTEAALMQLRGKPILWALTWRQQYVDMGVLIRLEREWMFVRIGPRVSGSGPLDLSEVAWLGEAVPVGS